MSDADQPQIVPNTKAMAIDFRYAVALFVYYIIMMLLCFYLSLTELLESGEHSEAATLRFSLSLCVVGAAIYYSRKLYKACISGSYNFADGTQIQKIGTFMFFLLRPLFAVVFAFVIYAIWTSSIITSVNGFQGFSKTHFYISGVVGFFVGFLAGRILTRMESAGEGHLRGVW